MRNIRVLCSVLVALFMLSLAFPLLAQEAGASARALGSSPAQEDDAAGEDQQPQTLATGDPSTNTEASFFLGGLVGGSFDTIFTGDFSLSSTLENGPTYGGRLGHYRFPFGVEGSFTYSNSGLVASADIANGISVKLPARVMYLEANVLWIIIPGPVQPFFTGGGGFHSYKLTDADGRGINKFGWNFGGGLKINVSRVALRIDVRDHMTSVDANDLGIDRILAEALGIGDQRLHNVEFTFGAGFRF